MSGRARRRRIGKLVLLLSAVAFAVTAVVAWQFSDRWLGDTLAEQINARIAGQVHIDGPVSLQVFPPRLTLGGVAWQGPGAGPSALRLDHLLVSSDWSAGGAARPLTVAVRGVHGELRQQADGQWQVPALRAAAGSADEAVAVKLVELTVSDVTLALIGLAEQATLRLDDVTLKASPPGWRASATGGASGAGVAVEGRVSTTIEMVAAGPRLAELSATLAGQIGPAQIESLSLALAAVAQAPEGAWQLAGLKAELLANAGGRQLAVAGEADSARYAADSAQVLGLQAKATVTPVGLAESLTATLTAVDLGLAGPQVSARGSAHLVSALAAGPVSATAERFHVTADLAAGRIDAHLPKVNTTLPDPAKAGRQIAVDAVLAGHWQLAERAGAGIVEAIVEDSQLKGQWQIALEEAHWLTVNAQVDRLDVDRWQTPGPKKPEALPLDAWRDWPLRLDLQVGRLRVQGLDAHNARLRLNTPE